MMHRTRNQPDFWSRRGIQPLPTQARWPLYRCPCWATEAFNDRLICTVCQQPANIEVPR